MLPDSEAEMRTQKDPKARYPWTIVHSFYALMGGFAFDTSKGGAEFLPDSRTRLTLNFNVCPFLTLSGDLSSLE